jgi:hypothetical protein
MKSDVGLKQAASVLGKAEARVKLDTAVSVLTL